MWNLFIKIGHCQESFFIYYETIEKIPRLITGGGYKMNPFGIFFIFFGILAAWKPYAAWYLEIGWKLEKAEPSEIALLRNRILGIIFTIIGIIFLF